MEKQEIKPKVIRIKVPVDLYILKLLYLFLGTLGYLSENEATGPAQAGYMAAFTVRSRLSATSIMKGKSWDAK